MPGRRKKRRRGLPDHLQRAYGVFLAATAHVEAAKEALVRCVPTGRDKGRPLGEGVFAFEEGLEHARESMPDWRAAEVESQWLRCESGLRQARSRAEKLRTEAPDLAFEPLLATVGNLLEPLEAFEAAEERFRELRS
jgi:hypothetical protein